MGLVITGGTTVTAGQLVRVASYIFTEPAGTNPTQSTALRTIQADSRSASLGAGSILRLKDSVGGSVLADLPLNTGASGPFDGSVNGVSALDLSPVVEVAAALGGVIGYYEFRTSGGVVRWSGTDVT